LRDKIEFDFSNHMPSTLAEMELLLTDGTRVTAQHDSGLPMTDVAAQGARLEEKFTALVEPVLGAARSRALIEDVGRFDALPDTRAMMARCGG